MSATIERTTAYFAELQQTADRLASSENPSPDEVQRLYAIVIELSQQGTTQAEVSLLDRDIVAIHDEDEIEETAEDIAPAAPPSAQSSEVHKSKHHRRRHGLNKLAHKIGKFVRKHKKKIIVGAVVAAAVGVTIATAGIGGAGAACAAGAGGAALRTKKREDDEPKTGAAAHGSSAGSSIMRGFDRDAILRTEGIRAAELKAKEQRYPGIVHPEPSMHIARQRANETMDRFKHELGHSIGAKEVAEATGIGLMLYDAAKSIGSIPAAGVKVGLAALMTQDMVGDYGSKVRDLYQPAKEAYTQLHRMEEANKQASLAKCTAEGYQPRLEFHPDTPQSAMDRSTLVDKNNPHPNQITVVLP